jgi:Rho-binding antiterminator
MTDYTPIDCGRHSEFEVAVLRRERLRIFWQAENGQAHIEVLTPIDLLTLAHEEFLVVRDQQQATRQLRLDRILKTETL